MYKQEKDKNKLGELEERAAKLSEEVSRELIEMFPPDFRNLILSRIRETLIQQCLNDIETVTEDMHYLQNSLETLK